VRELLPEEAPESLRRGILARAEGNPFFVEEILRMLVDRGILVPDEERGGWQVAPGWEDSDEVSDPVIPDTVQGVLAARLDLLSDDERDLLQHAAVVGRFFWPGALLSLHPQFSPETVAEVLDALQTKDLIRESERTEASVAPAGEQLYTFIHALTREVVYGSIPRTRRAHEHERVAEWLERMAQGRESEFADLLAQHFRQYYIQGNLARSRNAARRQAVREKVVRYQMLAGDQALARHAAAKAERYYAEALSLLAEDAVTEDVPRRVELYMKRGDAHWLLMHADAAWSDYREALRLWAAYSMLTLRGIVGDDEAGNARLGAVAADGAPAELAELPEGVTNVNLPLAWRLWGLRLYRLLVQLPTRFASRFQQLPTHEELHPYLEEGLALVDRLGLRETLAGAELLTAKAFFWWSWGERRGEAELLEALRCAREAVRITEALDDARGASEALDALGNIQAITTDLRGNLESQTRRLVWAQRLDDTSELVDIHAEVCMANMLVGDYRAAAEHGQSALRLASQTEAEALRLQALSALALTYCEGDLWRETAQVCTQLMAIAQRPGMLTAEHQGWALLACAIVQARTGARDESDRIAALVSELPSRTAVQFLELYRARLALARGAEREARTLLLEALEARSGRLSLPTLLAELAELGARIGDRPLYQRFGTQALELGWRSGARKALAQAIRARGIIAVADARWEDALADLEDALNRYHELGTRWEEARTRYALAGFYRRRNASGDIALAEEALRRALRLFEELHAVRDVARARAALAGGDVRLP
jgi:tetratricopeptide (TPR) repeat protein